MACRAGSTVGVLPLEAVGLEHAGEDPLALEQQRIGALAAEQQLGAERRHGHEARAVQHGAERVGELGVANRVRCGQVDGAADRARQRGGRWRRPRRRGDPAHPLRAGPEASAEADLEQRQQLGQRAGLAVEHDAGAQVHDAHAGRRRAGAVHASHASTTSARKPSPRARLLVELLVAAVAVEPDRRAGQQQLRAALGPPMVSASNVVVRVPRLQHLALVLVAPALVADAGAGQVDDGVDADERLGVEPAGSRIPADLAGPASPRTTGIGSWPRPAAPPSARSRSTRGNQ